MELVSYIYAQIILFLFLLNSFFFILLFEPHPGYTLN